MVGSTYVTFIKLTSMFVEFVVLREFIKDLSQFRSTCVRIPVLQ